MAKLSRLWAVAALCAVMAAPAAAEDATAATIVARVNGTEITFGQMISLRDALPEEYKSLPNDVLFKGILDQLIQQTLLEQSQPLM